MPKRSAVDHFNRCNDIQPHEAELMCQMIEEATGEPRPDGHTPCQAVAFMLDAQAREFWLTAARDAMRWTEIDGEMVTLH